MIRVARFSLVKYTKTMKKHTKRPKIDQTVIGRYIYQIITKIPNSSDIHIPNFPFQDRPNLGFLVKNIPSGNPVNDTG
jgi:hypothetical protein